MPLRLLNSTANVRSRLQVNPGIQLFDRRRSPDEGLTLMECVVAIAVIAITGALITPPLFLAAATRVQNRRAEQALQIAQGEIDRIRTLVEQGEHEVTRLPKVVQADQFSFTTAVAAPTEVLGSARSVNTACNTYDGAPLEVNQLLPIDVDGDDACDPDYYLQAFRTDSNREFDTKPSNFQVGVRVYAGSAADNLAQGGTLKTEQASLKFTTGEGNQRESPLAVLYSSITWSDRDFSLYCYHNVADCDPTPPATP